MVEGELFSLHLFIMVKTKLSNLVWSSDEDGAFWFANFVNSNNIKGTTGSYYDIDEDGKRVSREDQQLELDSDYEVVG